MVMMHSMGETRSSTPSYPSMASPRYGGCVSAFLHLFDWTAAKRGFSSTKRLAGSDAGKPDKLFRRSRSFRGDHGSAGKTRMMYHCQSGGSPVQDQPTTTRAPGVVARLMGLESLPQPARHRRSQGASGVSEPPLQHGTPILLQDLLKRDYKTSKRSLKDRIPAIFPKRGAQQESPSTRFRKKRASILTAFQCGPQVSCISPAYIDIPATSRFLCAVARSPRSPFLSRLPPESQPHTPAESPSSKLGGCGFLEEKIPELSLRASSTGSTVVLQGWPLESQHIVPPDIFQEDYYEPAVSTSFGSRPTDSASSKPLMGIGSYKVVEGRRRGSSWNGSEGSESTIEQEVHRKPSAGRGGVKKAASPSKEKSISSPHHRSSRSSDPHAFKTTRRPPSSKRSKPGKCDADLQLLIENSGPSISQESMSASSLGSISSKPPSAVAGKSKGSKAGRAGCVDAPTVKVKSQEDDERQLGKRVASSRSRSKEMAPGKPPPKVRSQKVVTQQEITSSRVFPANSPSKGAQSGDFSTGVNKERVSSYGVRLFDGRKEGDNPLITKKKGAEQTKLGSPGSLGGSHQHSSPTVQRFSEFKAGGVAGKQTTKRVPRLSESAKLQVQDLGDRLKKGNVNDEDMATQSSAASVGSVKGDDTDESTTLPSERRTKSQNRHARARSVDEVFPELPLENSALDSKKKIMQTEERVMSLHRPVERVLMFGQGFSSSPGIDFFTDCENEAVDQIATSPLVDFSDEPCLLEGLNISLVDYEDLPCLREYGEVAGLSSSPLIDCDELRSLGDSGPPASTSAEEESIHIELHQDQEGDSFAADDLRWEEDETVRTTLSGRCCERSCSGPSISSDSLPSDVDDEGNADSWSLCGSYDNLRDCRSPRAFEITEIDVEPESLNQEHQNSPPAQFVKKILDPTGLDPLLDDLAGQPSPVSILNAPFHDEACTTSECSLTDSTHQQLNSEEITDEQDLQPSGATTSVSSRDRIRQALLDISMFRSEAESCTLEAQTIMPPGHDTKDERSFIRGVLKAAHFLPTPGCSPNWHDKDVAIDPSLFDKLESGAIEEFTNQAAGGLWRCDRKLLFDCVNEAFGVIRLWHCQRGPEGLLEEELVWRALQPRGELLVVEVMKRIEEWRKLASYAIDSMIERDMNAHFGNWRCIGPEVAKVGLDIESTVWDAVLEEVVVDLIVSTSKPC